MMHYKSFLTEQMIWEVMKDHAFVYNLDTRMNMLMTNEEYIDYVSKQYGYTKEQILNDDYFNHPQSKTNKLILNNICRELKLDLISESTFGLIKQIEAVYNHKYINIKPQEKPKKINEDLMYISESTTENTINMVAVEVPKEEKTNVDVITSIKLNIDNETKNKVMQIASQYLGSILELRITNKNISKVQEYIKKEKLKVVEIKTAQTFTAENDWIRVTFCEDNVGIEFKK